MGGDNAKMVYQRPSVDFTQFVGSSEYASVSSSHYGTGPAAGRVLGHNGGATGADSSYPFMSIFSESGPLASYGPLMLKMAPAFLIMLSLLLLFKFKHRLMQMIFLLFGVSQAAKKSAAANQFRNMSSSAASESEVFIATNAAAPRNVHHSKAAAAMSKRHMPRKAQLELVEEEKTEVIASSSSVGDGVFASATTFVVACYSRIQVAYGKFARMSEGSMFHGLVMIPVHIVRWIVKVLRLLIISPWKHAVLLIRWSLGINHHALSKTQEMFDQIAALSNADEMARHRDSPNALCNKVSTHLTGVLVHAREIGVSKSTQQDLVRAIELLGN